jgi:hypothetical protein
MDYYRQKKGIELSDPQQPMIMANQSNMGALANVLPGSVSIPPEMSPEGAPPGAALALGKCLFMPLELCQLSGTSCISSSSTSPSLH